MAEQPPQVEFSPENRKFCKRISFFGHRGRCAHGGGTGKSLTLLRLTNIRKGEAQMERFEQLKELVMGMEADFGAFYDKGNNAAGTRVRKGMQELKNIAQDVRKEVQDKKNAG